MATIDAAKAALVEALISTRPTYLKPEELAVLIAAIADAVAERLAVNDSKIAAILNGAPTAFDTFAELYAQLAADETTVAGLVSSLSSKQPLDSDLTAIAALSPAAGKLLVGTASGWALLDATGIANDWAFVRDSTAASGFKFAAVSGGGGVALSDTPTWTGQHTWNDGTSSHSYIQIVSGVVGSGYNSKISAGPTNYLVLQGGGGEALFVDKTAGLTVCSGERFGWAASSTDPKTTSHDTALSRNAAGVVEINNGTAGTYRDLKLRNATLTGTLTFSDATTQTTAAPAPYIKAECGFSASGGTISGLHGRNVTSVTRIGTGQYRVTLTSAVTNGRAIASGDEFNTSGDAATNHNLCVTCHMEDTTHVIVSCVTTGNSYYDCASIAVIVLGD